jgi:dCMP deaminase
MESKPERSKRWTDHLMGFARHAATMSKDPSTQVGCVVIGPNNEVRSTGYNGLPRKVKDLPERMERPEKYLWTAHAEENAVGHAARIGVSLDGCVMFVTHHPCSRCARSIIQAGIKEVVVAPGTTHMDDKEFEVAGTMFYEADVFLNKLAIP